MKSNQLSTEIRADSQGQVIVTVFILKLSSYDTTLDITI